MATRKFSKKQIAEWTEEMRRDLKPGDKLHTVIRKVSASGMTRYIDVYRFIDDNGHIVKLWYSPRVAAITGYSFDEKTESVKVEGYGMDMAWNLIYNLSRVLFPEGFTKPNGEHQNDGGYALNQERI